MGLQNGRKEQPRTAKSFAFQAGERVQAYVFILLNLALLHLTGVVFYKLKGRPSTNKKITICFTAILTSLWRSGTIMKVCLCSLPGQKENPKDTELETVAQLGHGEIVEESLPPLLVYKS